jgi:hypothetical protein
MVHQTRRDYRSLLAGIIAGPVPAPLVNLDARNEEVTYNTVS